MVHHEGLLELDAIYLFETSPLIVRYREQPLTIRYADGNRLRRYTPDFELLLETGEIILVEVKPESRLRAEDVRHTLDQIKEHMVRSSVSFIVLSDQVIRLEPRLANLKWIYHRAARVPPTSSALEVVLQRHINQFPTSISAACLLLNGSGTDPYSFLIAGRLQCALSVPVAADTILTLNTEASHEWFRISQEHNF
jgi:hypothetical protein